MNSYIGLEEGTKDALTAVNAYFFPAHFKLNDCETADSLKEEGMEAKKQRAYEKAKEAFIRVLSYKLPDGEAREKTQALMAKLPMLYDALLKDLQAAYEGDPAAQSIDEILLGYPAYKAISTYRIAHELYLLKVPMIPRLMTELAHSQTGIDIHPGAKIGPYFFIDHGTGVVIGETTTIGEHVKLYQHVTLGAKSFEANPDGSLVKGIKRHPDIGDHVVIYAGATILGGDTHVGDHAIVGGNVWLTHSLPAGETITIRTEERPT